MALVVPGSALVGGRLTVLGGDRPGRREALVIGGPAAEVLLRLDRHEVLGPHGGQADAHLVNDLRTLARAPAQPEHGPGELLAEIRVPVQAGTGSAYEKVARRVGDWSVAAVGAVLRLGGGPGGKPGRPVVASAGLGLTAVGAEHFVAAQAEEYLRGRSPDEESFARAGKIAAGHCHPVADQRGPEDYKRHLVAELTTRALRRAAARAGRPS